MEGKEKERDIERDREKDSKSESISQEAKKENKKEVKENKGRFKKGNPIGMATRFQKGNTGINKYNDLYKDEYADMLLEYFKEPKIEIIYEEEYNKDGTLKKKTPKMILPPKFPTLEMFAVNIGVTSRTLREWAYVDENGDSKHPLFSSAYAQARERQFAIAKENAISKQYDSNFSKFILVNEFGMRDKQEVDTNVSGKLETPVDDKTLALIERVEKRMNEEGKQ